MTYREPTTEQYAKFGRYVASLLGANLSWSSPADYLEDIESAHRNETGIPLGDQDDDLLEFWRSVADKTGAYYDPDDEDDEEDDEE